MESGGSAEDSASRRDTGPREEEGFNRSNPVRSFTRTVRAVLLEPVGFFRRLPPRGSALDPVLFALVCSLISSVLGSLAAPYDPLVRDAASFESSVEDFGGEMGLAVGMLLLFVVLTPLFILLGLYIAAAVYHILVWIFVRPTDTDFEATLRVVTYTSAVELLTWIPVVGLLASLYGLYLAFVGIREMHETTTGRALTVISLPVVLFVVLTVLPLLRQSA